MIIAYNFIIRSLYSGLWLGSFFYKKAKEWIEGRKLLWDKLNETDFKNKEVVWFHVSSLGEFEQALPLIQLLQKTKPQYFFFVTFFSPSGYKNIYNKNLVDAVFYLPLDSKKNMQRFIKILRPKIVFVIKYDYWFNMLHELYKQRIPIFLVSANFRKHQIFFKWYGGLHRRMLRFFTKIFVQQTDSQTLLQTLTPSIVATVAGDTRFDRVLHNFYQIGLQNFEWLHKFKEKKKIACNWKFVV